MKIRHFVYTLLPAIAAAENATTVPDDEPLLPPLPEELLSPQKENAALPATAQPVVAYRAPKDEEQTWLKLLPVKPTEGWPELFQRFADSSHAKDMQMCHGYALWLKGQEIIYLRYDDDLSLSGIHADGHSYGVLYIEFSPYGIRVCPMEGYDLSGKNGGVCWQDAATRLWSWAESAQFWVELPKLLRADKGKKTSSAQDSAIKREVATKGQRMVVFWATPGYPARAWWANLLRLQAEVGPHRFSLIAPKGLNLWTDVTVPEVKPTAAPAPAPAAAPTAAPPAGAAAPAASAPAAPATAPAAPAVAAPASPAPTAAGTATAVAAAAAAATAPPSGSAASKKAAAPAVPDVLHPATGTPRDTAPAASIRPWEMTGQPAPATSSTAASAATPAARPAASTAPAAPASPAAAPAPVAQPAATQPAAPTATPANPAPATAPAAAPATAPAAEPARPARTLQDVQVPSI